MKKKLLAVNVALALGAMVVGSAAYAAAGSTALGDVDVLEEGAQAASFALPGNVVASDSYEGLINVVPYYSVQEGNTVALSITNNDIVNGKVVKVRFRGAEWSDDVLDFQVFLSPGDIWTAALTKEFDSITGQYVAKLNWSGDNTVTRPRLDAAGALFHADARVKGTNGNTLEGYVEIITLADIPPVLNGATAAAGTEFGPAVNDTIAATGTDIHTNPLYTLTKHVDGAAPPAYAISGVYDETIGKLVQDNYWKYKSVGAAVRNSDGLHTYTEAEPGNTGGGWTQVGGAEYQGHNQFGASKTRASDDWLQFPTPAISSYVSIINVQSRKAYTLQSTALRNAPVIDGIYQADDGQTVGSVGDGAYTTAAVTAAGKADAPVTSVRGSIKAYFEQKGGLYVAWSGLGEKITADNIFGGVDGGGPVAGAGVTTRLAGLVLQELDLPDLSTPTTAAVADVGFSAFGDTAATLTAGAGLYPDGPAAAQRDLVASALQAGAFRFEYVTDLGLQASTDIVLNQPVRRYYYWYSAGTSASHHREFTYPAGYWNISGERNTPYASLSGLGNSIEVNGAVFYNREEQSYVAATPGGSTWSPQPPASVTPTGLRGEVSVLAINSTAPYSGALSAQLTKNDTPVLGNYRNGWGSFSTATKANTGGLPATSGYGFAASVDDAHALLREVNWLPVIAYSAINVYSPASGAVYGTTLPVRILK
ncbi:hypothetical protein AGMMS50225_28110 [Betaproteobacteria bacterium]|nr:hypothetical protein AGMMS50225_28110 [Betaproteobacteria bacterium]